MPGLENVKLGAADGSFSQDFVNAAGEAAKGMYLSSPDFSAFGSGYQDFLKKHEEKYGEPPLSAFHAHAYDATNVIAAAIETGCGPERRHADHRQAGTARRDRRHQGFPRA